MFFFFLLFFVQATGQDAAAGAAPPFLPPKLGAGDADDARSLSGGLVVIIGKDVTSDAQAAEGKWWCKGAFGRKARSGAAAVSSRSSPASAASFLAVVSHSHRPPVIGLPLVTSKSQRAAKAVVSFW